MMVRWMSSSRVGFRSRRGVGQQRIIRLAGPPDHDDGSVISRSAARKTVDCSKEGVTHDIGRASRILSGDALDTFEAKELVVPASLIDSVGEEDHPVATVQAECRFSKRLTGQYAQRHVACSPTLDSTVLPHDSRRKVPGGRKAHTPIVSVEESQVDGHKPVRPALCKQSVVHLGQRHPRRPVYIRHRTDHAPHERRHGCHFHAFAGDIADEYARPPISEREEIEEIVRSFPGVRGVVNEIKRVL